MKVLGIDIPSLPKIPDFTVFIEASIFHGQQLLAQVTLKHQGRVKQELTKKMNGETLKHKNPYKYILQHNIFHTAGHINKNNDTNKKVANKLEHFNPRNVLNTVTLKLHQQTRPGNLNSRSSHNQSFHNAFIPPPRHISCGLKCSETPELSKLCHCSPRRERPPKPSLRRSCGTAGWSSTSRSRTCPRERASTSR